MESVKLRIRNIVKALLKHDVQIIEDSVCVNTQVKTISRSSLKRFFVIEKVTLSFDRIYEEDIDDKEE